MKEMGRRKMAMAAIACMIALVAFALGYLAGRAEPNEPETPSARVPVKPVRKTLPEKPLPLAHVELPKGEQLSSDNPDAYEAAFLNKPYRVIGTVDSISGTGSASGGLAAATVTGPVFILRLKPWEKESLLGPSIEVRDFDRKWALAVRPGDRVDANCYLERPKAMFFTFQSCTLNDRSTS